MSTSPVGGGGQREPVEVASDFVPVDLDEVMARAEKATPGPWRVAQGHDGTNWIDAGQYDEVVAPAPVECMAYCYGGSSRIELSDEDAAYLVAAANAVPAMARELAELRAKVEAVEALCVTLDRRDREGHSEDAIYGACAEQIRAALDGPSS